MRWWRRRDREPNPACQIGRDCERPTTGLHFCGDFGLGAWACDQHAREHMETRHGVVYYDVEQ